MIVPLAAPVWAQRKINPPPDNPWQNFTNGFWDWWHGRERHTKCFDYCDGEQPKSACTTTIYENDKAIEYYNTTRPAYHKKPSDCTYPEGNPGGTVIFGVVPDYEDVARRDGSISNLDVTSGPNLMTTAFGPPPPFLNIPFPPVYEFHTTPTPQGCVPVTGRDTFYVNHFAGTVTRGTACGGDISAVIPVGSNPLKIAVTPDGSLILVTMYDGGVAYIDPKTNQVVFTLPTPAGVHPSGLAISADGTLAYITSYIDINPEVLVINIAQRQIIATIPVTTYPQSVYLTPDGMLAYVTFPFDNAIYVIDTFTLTIARTVAFTAPYGLAFNSTGTRAYIASQSIPGTVQVMDTTSYQIVGSYTVGDGPVDVVISNDDEFLFVTNNGSGSVSIIDLVNNNVQTIPTGPNPRGPVQVQ